MPEGSYSVYTARLGDLRLQASGIE